VSKRPGPPVGSGVRQPRPFLPLPLPLPALRVLRRDRRGSSSPVVIETPDGDYVVKLRGAAQGTAALVAEIVVAALADTLALPVPSRRIITIGASQLTDDRNDELADLLDASVGDNLGFRYLPTARPLQPWDLATIPLDFAAQVRWLDWLIMNPDRGPGNPNILVDGSRYWLIDHGAALPFQHDWQAVTETSPLRAAPAIPHVFDGITTHLAEWDPLLTALVTREALAETVALIPDSFLRPLLPPPWTAEAAERRRLAYAAFLWKRLGGPRPFGAVPTA
jgi:HipA-like protein